MSSVAEIEAAIEKLPADQRRQLRQRFGVRSARTPAALAISPKTGAELASLWPRQFHLRAEEADAWAVEMNDDRKSPPHPPTWE
jgi:hypothetical protein